MESKSPQYKVLDFFAGDARIARAARCLGEQAAAFDISYHSDSRVFDINTSPGFVLLYCIMFAH